MDNHLVMIADDVLTTLATSTTSFRDKALVLMLAESGLRLSELAELDRTSIASESHVFPDGTVRIIGHGQTIEGKWRGRGRDFWIGPLAMAALDEYLTAVHCDDNQAPMFLSTDGDPLDSRAIGNLIRKLIGRLGLAPLPAHDFRRSLVLRFLNAGLCAGVVKRLLGYADTISSADHAPLKQGTLLREYLLAIRSFPWYQRP